MKTKISLAEWDRIFGKIYNSNKFENADDIVKWMKKKWEVLK